MNRILILLVVTGLSVPQTLGQNGSLRKAGQSQPPVRSTPQQQPREIILPAPAQGTRTIVPGTTQRPVANPELLRISLLAVEPPQPRTIQPHDLVTIIVREDKTSISDSRLQSEKSWELETRLREWFRITNGRLVANVPQGEPGIDFEMDNSYEGQGRSNRIDQLTTRITAEVIDVKPNGVLTIQARKAIELDEDIQIITLTGQIRTDDINANNQVLSTQIANSNISVRHTGPARDASRRGWLMRAFDLLRPF